MISIYKIFPFLRKKIDIVCYNEKEWNNMQLELFNLGYYWEIGKEIIESGWDYPRILKNYRTGDIFGSNILIMDSYNFVIRNRENINLINATSYIRKLKLKKLNGQHKI